LNTPVGDSTPRKMYEEAQKQGMPTPLDNPPTYSTYFEQLVLLFWDITHYKTEYNSYIALSMIESYQNLFEVKIHPTYISLLCRMDRAYVIQINKILKETTT
jgi:hypothetical protein